MWIEKTPSSLNSFLQLYNDFSNSLLEEERQKLLKVKQYCGNERLMRIFLQCHYQDRIPNTVGDEIMRWSRNHYAKKNNWQNILESYRNFRRWVNKNPSVLNDIKEINYRNVREQILSLDNNTATFQEMYTSWEDYLKRPERASAFDTRKELHCAYNLNSRILRKLWNKLPLILFHISSDRNSYASKYVEESNDKKLAKQESFDYVVDKILDDEWFTQQEIRHKTGEILGNMEWLRHRIHKIVWYYSAWSRLYQAQKSEELLNVLQKKQWWPKKDKDWQYLLDFPEENQESHKQGIVKQKSVKQEDITKDDDPNMDELYKFDPENEHWWNK